jgi:glycosyltransferase involved in cell wall biosynthesis
MSDQAPQPKVTVIMTVYNFESYVGAALDSLIAQTYSDLEIIVVDDHSSDGSWAIIRSYADADPRIKPFRNEQNLKQTASRNFALRQATGRYLAQLDGDDIRTPSSIELQVDFLETHPDVVAVGGGAEICDIAMRRINYRSYPTDDAGIRRAFFRYSPFCQSSLMVRRDLLEHDPYRIAMEPAEDIDLTFRLGTVGKLANISDVVYKVRTHRTSVTQTQARAMELKTLYIRLKAAQEYGYQMTRFDRLYLVLQLATMYAMPSTVRFWLFNKLRSSR